jgi:hypothetical protein
MKPQPSSNSKGKLVTLSPVELSLAQIVGLARQNRALVVGRIPTFRIVGWIPGKDAKQEKYWRTDIANREPAWFVPQANLRDIEKLIAAPELSEVTP